MGDTKRHEATRRTFGNLLILQGLVPAAVGHKLCNAIPGGLFKVRIRSAAGFAIIDLLFVCGIIGLLSGIALPRLMVAKYSAQAASAISTLRTIGSGEVAFAIT